MHIKNKLSIFFVSINSDFIETRAGYIAPEILMFLQLVVGLKSPASYGTCSTVGTVCAVMIIVINL